MKIVIAATAFVALSGCAGSPDRSPAPSAPAQVSVASSAAAPVVEDGDKQVCKRLTVAGSIRPTRVCATRSEWDAQTERDRENQEEFDRNRRSAEGARTFE